MIDTQQTPQKKSLATGCRECLLKQSHSCRCANTLARNEAYNLLSVKFV